ncbi:unnamed protein product [Pedinophyceae sp. YPF-701]|nr:unnamed protein product [Pedinophyceae sp. YPF-701]
MRVSAATEGAQTALDVSGAPSGPDSPATGKSQRGILEQAMTTEERDAALRIAKESAEASAGAAGLGEAAPAAEGGPGSKFFATLGYAMLALGAGATYAGLAYDRKEVEDAAQRLRDEGSPLAPAAALYAEQRARVEKTLEDFSNPPSDRLLPDLELDFGPHAPHVRTLVLDLDHVLVHSSWTRGTGWRTFKRPGAEELLRGAWRLGYEVVLYTDQSNVYADPIMDRLDPNREIVRYRLYRESTLYTGGLLRSGNYVRDLSKLNRDPRRVMYVTATPESILQKDSSLLVSKWEGEAGDTALLDFLPFLEMLAQAQPADLRDVVRSYEGKDVVATFKERMKKLKEQRGGGSGGGASAGAGRRRGFGGFM